MPHSRRWFTRLPFAAVAFALLVAPTLAENWPHWRGPTQNGISTEKSVPTEWSTTKNVAWKVELPGPGGASPVVFNDRIFVTAPDGEELKLLCFNTAGKKLWEQTVGKGRRSFRRDEGNLCSPSPTTDGKHVWSMMGTGDVGCYDINGKQVWKFNLQDRFGRFRIQFGMASSPTLWKDRLLFQLIHGDGRASTQEAIVVALDKATGKTLWKKDRVTGASRENEHSYASGLMYDFGDKAMFITHGADYTIAYDPKTGDEVWRLGGLNPQDDPNRRYHPTLRFVASPGFSKDLIVVPTAKNQQVFAIKPTLTGNLTGKKEAIVWTLDRGTPDVPSPLIHDGLVYLCRENGNLNCFEAKTGKRLYEERTNRQRHRASPVYADGKIYLSARDGKVTVVQAGKEFKILAQNDLNDDLSASPAISNGTIYIRTFGALWAIREK